MWVQSASQFLLDQSAKVGKKPTVLYVRIRHTHTHTHTHTHRFAYELGVWD